MANPKALVSDLRDLAKDPDNFRFIINEDEVISGLENFVASNDHEVCTIALNAVLFLAVNPKAHPILAARERLVESLIELKEMSSNKSILHLSDSILGHLSKHIDYSRFSSYSPGSFGGGGSGKPAAGGGGGPLSSLASSGDTPRGFFNSPTPATRSSSSRHLNTSTSGSRTFTPSPLSRSHTVSALGANATNSTLGKQAAAPRRYQPKFLKTTVYQIENMVTADDQIQVETAILKVKGVVSVSCDGVEKRVTVYSSASHTPSLTELHSPEGSFSRQQPAHPNAHDRHEAHKNKVLRVLKGIGFPDVKCFDLDEDEPPAASSGDDLFSPPRKPKPQYIDPSQEHDAFRADLPAEGGGAHGAGAHGGGKSGFSGQASELSIYLTTDGYQNTLEARLARKRAENLEAMRKRNRLADAMDMVKSFFW